MRNTGNYIPYFACDFVISPFVPQILFMDECVGAPDLSRLRHFFRAHPLVEFCAGYESEPHRFLAQRGAVGMRRLGDLGGLIVADARGQRRHQHQ